MKQTITLMGQILPELGGKRLDQALSQMFPEYSRAQLQTWIRGGFVMVDEHPCAVPKTKVLAHQTVRIIATLEASTHWVAQAIPLSIVYEDEALIVINKPAGLIVHPGAGAKDNTLVNALLHHAPELSLIPRAGIIHRLDKDTSGLLVIARTLEAHHALIQQMKCRQILREYETVVHGVLISGGTIETAIGRHPIHRTRMAVVQRGKPAITHYRIITRYSAHTHLRIRLETGRTHQIRVHMAHIRHPIVGDHVYGKSKTQDPFPRQALHAIKLSLTHPLTHQVLSWEIPLPDDIKNLILDIV